RRCLSRGWSGSCREAAWGDPMCPGQPRPLLALTPPFPTGEHLRICPQGYTCCTSEMEENLANRSRTELETALRDSSRALQATLATQLHGIDGHFQSLLNESERALQEAFPDAFGGLYTQNARAFRDLYAELRLYYRGANLHLEETLAEFWARLLERLFRQLHPQLLLPDDYLDCLGKQAEALRPFGESPRELRLRATRAFVAARSFVQGLGVASDVVRKVAQVPLGPECSRAVMKLVYCAHCLGVPGARPCPDYCRNVLKGCLANQADLDTEWRNLLDSMVLVTDKFWGPSGAESVIGSVHMWVAEAINALQDNKDTLTAKVRAGATKKTALGLCGCHWPLEGRWVPPAGGLGPGGGSGSVFCWHGPLCKMQYLPEVMGDGLANQINNPEVEVDITKPDMTIRQQIMQLKIMTNRLRGAYSGSDVDFQDASDDGSGSGSGGGCPDDICGRRVSKKSSSSRTPLTHALPGLSEREGQKTSAAGRPQPRALLLLLLLLLVLAAARPRWR
uniref:Glypican-1 n=1 Tax=Marmota marmota marmota TaxID=9994 RepID=A0A8C6EPH9_MARMA